ncbi:hypothetical protein, partial [Salmonella sp. s51228]|uniref:hypothetical protein n=1 Tax=Salmonella sp. s51228 TaxID=3159652 RepID=UPI0039804E28
QDLRHLLLKFSNQPLKKCGEDILVSLTELLLYQTTLLIPLIFSDMNSSLSLEGSDKQEESTFMDEEVSTTLKPESNNTDHGLDDVMPNNLQNGYHDLVIIGKHLSTE